MSDPPPEEPSSSNTMSAEPPTDQEPDHDNAQNDCDGSSSQAGNPPNSNSSSAPTASTNILTLGDSIPDTSLPGKSKASGSKGGRAPWAAETQESWLFEHLEMFFEAQGAGKVSDFLATHWALWVSAFPETVKAGSCELTKEFKTDEEATTKMQTVSNHKRNATDVDSQTFPEI